MKTPIYVMMSKSIATLLMLVGVFAITACGGGSSDKNASSSSSSSGASNNTSSSSTSSSSGSMNSSSGSMNSSSGSSSSSGNSSSSSSGLVDMSGGLAYQMADGTTGGQLYAMFWASETGFTFSNSNLDNQAQLETIVAKGDFFRCVQCHGWDRLGRQGGYSNRAPTSARPRVADVDLAKMSETLSPQALFDGIKRGANYRSVIENLDAYNPDNNFVLGDKMPNYSEILTDAQIWNIVKFLKEDALDTTALYDIVLLGSEYPRSRGFLNMGIDGSPVAGERLYEEKCSVCHGPDGTTLRLDDGLYTVGGYIRSKPYEAQHIIKFGHLGSIMGPVLKDSSLSDIQDLFATMRDANKFPDTKPDIGPDPEPIDGAMAFLRHCSGCHSGGGEGPSNPRYGDVTGASASLINTMIQTEPNMRHLKPDDPAQAVSLAEVDAIAAFLAGN